MPKICSICRETKLFPEFGRHANHSDGYTSECKECLNKRYDENRTELLRKRRERRKRPEVKEKDRVYDREYRKKNSMVRIAKAKEYHHAHPEWSREQGRKYYWKHREERIAYQKKIKVRKKNLPSTLTTQEWDQILARHNFRCRYCGSVDTLENPLEKDHKIPVSKGGGYTKENMVPACRRCNSRKYNRTDGEFEKVLRAEAQKELFDLILLS